MPGFYSDARNAVQREDLLAWGTVRAALALTFVGGLLTFVSLFVVVVIKVTTEGQPPGAQALTVFVQMASGITLISGIVLTIAGACMNCAAPSESGVKGWGIGTCIFVAIALVVVSILMIAVLNVAEEIMPGQGLVQRRDNAPAPRPPFGPQEARLLGYASQGACLLGVGCFLMALRGIAQHFGHRGLAIGVVAYLLVYFLYVIGLNVLYHSKPEIKDVSQVQALAWIVLGGFVLLGVWGIVLIALVRSSLTSGMLRV